MIYLLKAPLIFFFVSFILTAFVVGLNSALIEVKPDSLKNMPYECGFRPFDNNIQQYEIKYYIVALLFLLFDVETIFIVPFITVINFSNLYIYSNMFLFLFLLLLGLFYEWKNNYLEWE